MTLEHKTESEFLINEWVNARVVAEIAHIRNKGETDLRKAARVSHTVHHYLNYCDMVGDLMTEAERVEAGLRLAGMVSRFAKATYNFTAGDITDVPAAS